MNLYIYSDASVCNGIYAAVCGLMLTDKQYIGCKIFKRIVDRSPLEAEVFGIVKVLEYVVENDLHSNVSNVIVYTDCTTIIKCVEKKRVLLRSDPELNDRFFELIHMTNCKVQLIKGHQRVHNPNKFVDNFARYNARRFAREVCAK